MSDTGELSRARVVLFATHGLVTGAFDGLTEPALALSPPLGEAVPIDDPGGEALGGASLRGIRVDDGLLTASEVAQLRLQADWVILSACDTAAGGDIDADGLTGLAQSFFFAGAESLLVSHWPVLDAVAAQLTTQSVSLSAGGVPAPEAFRQSMKALVEGSGVSITAHPAVWAPFHVVGVSGAP